MQYDVNGNPKKTLSAKTFYRNLSLEGPCGDIAASEVASKQALVDQISGDEAKKNAQRVVDGIKIRAARKDKLKAELAQDAGHEAKCFDGGMIGASGRSCKSVEEAFAASTSNGSTGDQVTCKFACNCWYNEYCSGQMITDHSCDRDIYSRYLNITKTFATAEEGQRAIRSVCSGRAGEGTISAGGLFSPCNEGQTYQGFASIRSDGATVSCSATGS